MSKSDSDSMIILAEEMKMQRTQILEALQGFKDVPKKVDKLTEDMQEVKSELRAIKKALTDHSKQLNNHEKRITVLEAV